MTEAMRKWRIENHEYLLDYAKKYRDKNRDRLNAYYRDAYKRNIEKRRSDARKYYQRNKDKRKIYCKKFREENRAKIAKRQREWHKKHPHWYRDRSRAVKAEVFEHYGKACSCCGESRLSFLTIDHIQGGGTKHRDEVKCYGSTFYFWLKRNNFPPGYQPLCWNCNFAKGFFGVCPHELERQSRAAD